MIKYINSQGYTLDGVPETPSFLPEDLDTTDLLEITPLGANYKQYLDPVTGDVHDGQKYYEQMALEYTEREIYRVANEAQNNFLVSLFEKDLK